LVRFFHQPSHYPDLLAVQNFLGERASGGAFQVISAAYYSKLEGMLPPDVKDSLAEGRFEHPDLPAYYVAAD
jgi:hypothetical protein